MGYDISASTSSSATSGSFGPIANNINVGGNGTATNYALYIVAGVVALFVLIGTLQFLKRRK